MLSAVQAARQGEARSHSLLCFVAVGVGMCEAECKQEVEKGEETTVEEEEEEKAARCG